MVGAYSVALAIGFSAVQRLLYPLGDVIERSTGSEDLGDPNPLQLRDVGLGDDPACEYQHIAGAARGKSLDDARHQRHVSPGEDGQPDGVGILLNDRLGNLLRRLVQPGVDDLEAGLAEGARDDPGPAVVT